MIVECTNCSKKINDEIDRVYYEPRESDGAAECEKCAKEEVEHRE